MSSLKLPKPAAGHRASLVVPGDKSITHRALMLAAIAGGQTHIVNANDGLDVRATVRALRQLGVPIARRRDGYDVTGVDDFRDPRSVINCGNSGTTMRLLMGLLAGRANALLDGDASLRRRPMSRVASPLNSMGAAIVTAACGKPPVRIRRSDALLAPIRFRLPVASAQLKSALLLAALRATGPSVIIEPFITRDHTEIMLRAMGATLSAKNRTLRLRPSRLASIRRLRIPGDFSIAVYMLCAAASIPGARLQLRGVGINPTRTAALGVLQRMGTRLRVASRRCWSGEPVADLSIAGGVPLRNVAISPSEVPILIDEIPALCALAAAAQGTFLVRGAQELRVKESDRVLTTVQLLRAFGADARGLADGIIVRGGRALRAPRSVATNGDHRIGMAAAILAVAARSPLVINDAECIATSFPGFAATWRRAFAQKRT